VAELLDIAKSCAETFMAAEIALVGQGTADDVIDAAVSGEKLQFDESTSSGRQNDIIEAIKLLFEFAAFVKTLADLYVIFKAQTGRKPSSEELLAESGRRRTPVEPQKAKSIVRAVIDLLDQST
jgi:hypothetical protein